MANKYRVKGKFIYYASTMDIDMGMDSQGNPRIVRQMGPIDRVEVGTILEDVPAHVLAAFPNRFELVPESAPAGAQAPQVQHSQPEPEPAAPPGQAHRVQTEDQVGARASSAAEPRSEDAQPEPPGGSARSRR